MILIIIIDGVITDILNLKEMYMKNLSKYLVGFGILISPLAYSKPVVCDNPTKRVSAVLDISGPFLISYVQNVCLKRDESEPGCNDYYAYSCPCIQYGKPTSVRYYKWAVTGEIRNNGNVVRLSPFEMKKNGNVIEGKDVVYTGSKITNPKYELKIYKTDKELVAVIILYDRSSYDSPGTVVQASCVY